MATSLGQWLLGSGEINFWGRLYQDATHRDGFFEHVFFLKICFLICWTSFSLSKYVKITILGVIPHLLQGMKHPLIGPWQLSKTQRVGGFIFHRSTMLAFPYCFDVCCCFFVSVVVCCPNANQVNICFCWYPVYIIYSLCLFCTNSSPIIMYIIIIYIYIYVLVVLLIPHTNIQIPICFASFPISVVSFQICSAHSRHSWHSWHLS